MIAFLAPFFLRAGLGEKGARIAAWALLAVIAAGALGLVVLRIRNDAVSDERNRVAAEQAIADAAQRGIERIAEDRRRRELTRAQTEAANRQKEIDDETRHLPATPTSARQRVRACAELRRQAASRGEPAPAC